jgi:hypothetical protein
MKSVICTLFEGNYHLGLAALINSLERKNFNGELFVGYRGDLPQWILADIEPAIFDDWPNAQSKQLSDGITMHLLPVSTNYHFTNYKPHFMLELWNGLASEAEMMYYLDPDIVVTCHWNELEKWAGVGVALCEDVNSPISANHPKRLGWRKYFAENGIRLSFKEAFYVNAGFIGLHKNNIKFVEEWKNLIEAIGPIIGGLSRSSLSGNTMAEKDRGDFAPFSVPDQDALNATIEATKCSVSIAPKVAMAFEPGKALLPHALGQPKPWDTNYLSKILNGKLPRLIDKQYWKNANGLIKSLPSRKVRRKRRAINFATFVGRFYTRK